MAALAFFAVLVGACGGESVPRADDSPSTAPGSSAFFADDPTAPVVVTGRFLDRAGAPAAGASVSLQVMDVSNAQIGQAVPIVFSAETTTGLDGSFRFRFFVPADLRAFAKANNDFINFDLSAIPSNLDTDQVGVWSFPRHLAAVGPGFEDEAPTVTLRPIGAPPAAP
jgi:hypothetical protein